MKKQTFNATEKRIMRLLYQSKAELTAYEVAKKIGISYPTARKYLEKLVKQEVIEDGST